MRPLLLLLLLPFTASEAVASTLYRCTGKDGVTAYTSSRAGYSNCKSVGSFAAPPAQSPAPRTASADARVEFRTAPAGGQPAAVERKAGADTTVTRGAVYKYVRNGVTHYTNRRPAGQGAQVVFTYTETCFACSVRPGLDFQAVALNTTAFDAEIRAAAEAAGLDEALVRAVIHAESAFNPNALSHKGAQGLMQLMPATAQRFGVAEPFTPTENIRGGTTYLAWLLKRFDGDTRLATAAYNAGEGSVDRFGGVPPYDETVRYVERVAILHGRYRGALASAR